MSSEAKSKPEKNHNNEAEKSSTPHEGKKSLKKWIIIGLVIALLLLTISAAVYFFLVRGKNAEKTADSTHAQAEKHEKAESPEEKEKSKDGEPKAPDEASVFPLIFFTEKLTLPLAAPENPVEKTAGKMTARQRDADAEKETQKFLLIRLAFEFENEDQKKAFAAMTHEIISQIAAIAAVKKKEELVSFSGKIKFRLELSKMAERITDGKIRPQNIFFTDFTIQ